MAIAEAKAPERRIQPAKAKAVEEYAAILAGAKSVYLADYIGLDVESMQELRKTCREQSVAFRVVKNRLLKLAAEEAGLPGLGEHLSGPIALASSTVDEVSPAKLITRFAKAHKKPTLKGAILDGVVYGPDEAEALSKLPSFDEVRAQVLNVISAPATQLVRVLAAPGTQLVRVLDARREQLESNA